MNLEQLEVFAAVAELGSFTRAAESLYISHSTTSRQVSALEQELEVRLFVRSSRSVKLTPEGELLYTEGKHLLEEARQLTEKIKQMPRAAEQTESEA